MKPGNVASLSIKINVTLILIHCLTIKFWCVGMLTLLYMFDWLCEGGRNEAVASRY